MALKYQPKERAVVMCDFTNFIAPEMIKIRPVIVIAKHRKNANLVTIVPLSTTKPEPLESHHYPMPINPLPDKAQIQCWVKCDMIYTVSLARLDRYKLKKREYIVPEITQEDFEQIKKAVAKALKLSKIHCEPERGLKNQSEKRLVD